MRAIPAELNPENMVHCIVGSHPLAINSLISRKCFLTTRHLVCKHTYRRCTMGNICDGTANCVLLSPFTCIQHAAFSMSMEDYDYLFKIVLIGNAGVGKTCLVRRFTQGLFPPGQGATIGVDFMIKTVEIKGEKVKLQIWDTAGQERFRSITQSYYRSANALILTYDITCEDSFRCLPEWLREIEQYANNQVVTILVGNKIDLAEKREVLRQRAEDFAEAQSMLYLETSAKESDNVEKLFLDLACELIREAKQNKLDNNDTAPMPGEGKTISYLSCCSLN
ncbi:ras-related protein Rab-30 isoform X1 [Xiphias gladius]|nr:ras-related protein Rab-30 isoform X1 [Xiphias gladius]